MIALVKVETKRISGRLRLAGAEEFIDSARLSMLNRLGTIYEEQGVLAPTSAPALHACCPDAADCWRAVPPAARPSSTNRAGYQGDRAGSIAWPWVGKDYRHGGVVVVGLNFRFSDDCATVALEYLAAQNDLEQFGDNRKISRFGSAYPYRSTARAAAVCASLDGDQLVERPPAESLPAVLERICRLQLVKCMPVDSVVVRGAPSRSMRQHCPPRFLYREIEVLQPVAVIGFGNDVYFALEAMPEVHWRSGSDYLCRGTLRTGEHQATVLWLPHPTTGRWPRGQQALIRSLRAKRIEQPRARQRESLELGLERLDGF